MAFLFEPYNAYQKPPKKKHWMEIAEEEALLHRVQLEEQSQRQELFQEALKQHLALREANAKANQTNLNNQNVALPQYAPQPASQQVQNGQYAAPAGGGGWVLPSELEAQEIANFSATPQSGIGPLTVTFVNLSESPENDTFFWDFGSGSVTSTSITPAPLIYTQTGSYTVTLQETSSVGAKTKTSKTITVSDPALYAWLNLADLSTPAPYSASLTGTHTYNGKGTVSGQWSWGDGTAAVPYTAGVEVVHIYTTGSWTASLALTESSYGHTNVATVYISASLPWLSPLFTVTSESRIAPATASFDNTSTYYVNDTFVYRWVFGDGTANSSLFEPTHVYHTGSFPVRLEMSESYYGIKSVYVLPGGITESAPTLTVAFVTQSVGFGGAAESYMEPVTNSYTASIQYDGVGSFTYFWNFGTGSLTSTSAGPIGNIYYTSVGPFTASLQLTESSYNIARISSQSFYVDT